MTQNSLGALDYTVAYFLEGQFFPLRRHLYLKNQSEAFTPTMGAKIDFSKVDFDKSFYDACCGFLNRVSSKNKETFILYSGGIDSEVLLWIAIKEGYKVKPVTVDLFGINHYDLRWAQKFIKKHQLQDTWQIIHIDFNSWLNEWLPQLCYFVESPSYILSAALIAALHCPDEAPILTTSSIPYFLLNKEHQLYFSDNEYDLWPAKLRFQSKKNIYDLFWDAQVYSSFLNHPMIQDRLVGLDEYSEDWSYDIRSLGKEYFYSSPPFDNLDRRLAVSGWEQHEKLWGFRKDLHIGGDPSPSMSIQQPQKERYVALERTLALSWDYIKGKSFLNSPVNIMNEYSKEFQNMIYHDLSKAFYLPVGPLKNMQQKSFDQDSFVITKPIGKIESFNER